MKVVSIKLENTNELDTKIAFESSLRHRLLVIFAKLEDYHKKYGLRSAVYNLETWVRGNKEKVDVDFEETEKPYQMHFLVTDTNKHELFSGYIINKIEEEKAIEEDETIYGACARLTSTGNL